MSRKTVLVTGASRGIGKAIAIKFARKGYNVVISCIRNEDRLMQTKKEIENYIIRTRVKQKEIRNEWIGHGINCMTVWMLTDFCYQVGRIGNVCLHPCCGSGGLWLLYGSEYVSF